LEGIWHPLPNLDRSKVGVLRLERLPVSYSTAFP
jgi:hypothetical protein